MKARQDLQNATSTLPLHSTLRRALRETVSSLVQYFGTGMTEASGLRLRMAFTVTRQLSISCDDTRSE